jgi:hypothetical protein
MSAPSLSEKIEKMGRKEVNLPGRIYVNYLVTCNNTYLWRKNKGAF